LREKEFGWALGTRRIVDVFNGKSGFPAWGFGSSVPMIVIRIGNLASLTTAVKGKK